MAAANRSPLGRGLASLIPDSSFGDDSSRPDVRLVPREQIRANPEQPREVFDNTELDALSESIREHGILSPLIVRKEEGAYVLIAGERRLRAAALAGLTDVPVIVRKVTGEAENLELALIENLQRQDLDPIEAAKGYRRLMDEYGLTQEQVATKVGKERPTIANALRLLKLPDEVLDAVRDNQISAGHARALIPLVGTAHMRRALLNVVDLGLSVRATEQLVNRLLRGVQGESLADKRRRDLAMAAVNRRLTKALSAGVTVKPRKHGGGRIVIDFADNDDLDRLISLMEHE
ncbi:MAG: ParB/RepB/Spo0J family partition protein [Deltaproteobacteria bacterium]|nr:MAG: ParB/RepB/Spo0J family partition protein [Deltaproteobacteria bacterium]